MNIDIGKTIRLSDIIDAKDNKTLIIDTTVASAVGATDGLLDAPKAFQSVNEQCDGLIVNPGQAEHQAELLGGKHRAAPIIRVDWTNAYRDEDFCLPATKVRRFMISNADDAFTLGASAVAASLMLGYDDAFEAQNIEDLSHLARACHPISLPLIVDIRPIGPGVSKNNFEDSIQLGVSFMHELGADMLIIPECSLENANTIANWMSVPVLMRYELVPEEAMVKDVLGAGIAGVVLSEKIFKLDAYGNAVKDMHEFIHVQ